MSPRARGVPARAVIRNAWRFGRRPWIAWPMVALEVGARLDLWTGRRTCDGRAGRIRQLSLRLTDRCHLRCRTCGQWGEAGFLHDADLSRRTAEEVAPERWCELLDDLAAHGHRPLLYLWGGEPTLYRGLETVVAHASRLGMPTSIATNGGRVAELAEPLASAPLYLLQVSVDGPDAALHDRLRPAAGGGSSFAEVERSIEAVHRERRRHHRDLPMVVALVTVSDGNAGRLADVYDAFRDRVDAFVLYLSWWIDEARARDHDAEFERRFGVAPATHRAWVGSWRPRDPAAVAADLAEIDRRSRRVGAPPVIRFPDLRRPDDVERYYRDHPATFGHDRCLAVHRALEVTSRGDVTPCRDYPDWVVGNVRDATLTELWNHDRMRRFRRSLDRDGLMPVCSRCCGLMGY